MSSVGSASSGTADKPAALVVARRRANHRIAWVAHALVFSGMMPFLLLVAGFFPTVIVALAWGTGLAVHGYFAVVAHELRERWIGEQVDRELNTSVARERKALGDSHARAMERLSAAVAHEIRNPITAAKSLVQQIEEDPGSSTTKEHARVAVEELDRVERSIGHLLRYAREEEIAPVETRLVPIVDSALATLRDRLSQIDVRRDHAENDSVRADPDALRRVVVNLVGNAIDALEERGPATPRVAIATGHDLAGREVWLRVRDNGAGITSADPASVFEPFRTTKTNGTGLGLAIAKKIVVAHGGRIEVTPGVTDGAEIVVTLPRTGAA